MLPEWKKYEQAKESCGRLEPNYFDTVNLNLEFFKGNQWKNLKSNGMPTPVFNILKRGLQFFVASLMSNRVKINFSPLEFRDDGDPMLDVAEIATSEVDNLFDKFKMDNRIRDALFDAGVMGDVAAHIYFNPNAMLNTFNIFIYTTNKNVIINEITIISIIASVVDFTSGIIKKANPSNTG